MDVEIKGVLEGVSVGESLEGCGGPGGGLAAGEVGGCGEAVADELFGEVELIFPGVADAVPFDHGEFGVMAFADFCLAEDFGDLVDGSAACGKQAFHEGFG